MQTYFVVGSTVICILYTEYLKYYVNMLSTAQHSNEVRKDLVSFYDAVFKPISLPP